MIIQTSEKRPDGLSIYWLADNRTGERVCGVCFENGLLNIANQGTVESLVFALAWMQDDLGPWLGQEKQESGGR